MDRLYKIIATRYNGTERYWEPTLGQFTRKDIPTNRYHDFPEADDEYRKAIDLAEPDDIESVRILEYRQKDDTWYTLTYIEFSQNERSTESILVDIGTARLDMKTASGRLCEIAELSKLSRETREEIERISNKLYSLSQLTWNLQEKVLKELEKDVHNEQD
nr:MAG TPA: hypothetical protein [Caudoviricetes sp.]